MAPPRRLPAASERLGAKTMGQALVETAILLPILLILLLGAIDFGRLFFGWVNLNQTTRIAANFAATHPSTSTDPDDQDELISLIDSDAASLNCNADVNGDNSLDMDDLELSYTTPDGSPTTNAALGDYATLSMECEFSLLTPLASIFFGDTIDMGALSTFPVRAGCVSCPAPAPVPPPPTPVQCRLIPDMERLSLAGARAAWESAGFNAANFLTASTEGTATVDSAIVDQIDTLSTCVAPFAIFSSKVTITILQADDESDPSCATVPNLVGITVAQARVAWEDAEFDPANFAATDGTTDESRRVVAQETAPPYEAGVECGLLTATVGVTTGDPLPTPPPRPCEVPSLINLKRNDAVIEWVDNEFSAANFNPTSGNFIVKSQSLVGGNGQWVDCSASITVAPNP